MLTEFSGGSSPATDWTIFLISQCLYGHRCPLWKLGIRIVSQKPGDFHCRKDWNRAPWPMPMLLCQPRCVTCARASPCLHNSVCLMVSGQAFLVMPAKEKQLANVGKMVPGTCPLRSAFCASFTFCIEAYTESRRWLYFSLLSKSWSVGARFIMGICWAICLQHLQLKQPNPEVAKILALPEDNSNGKSSGGDECPDYLVTFSWRFQHSSAKEKRKGVPGTLYFISIMYFSKQRWYKMIQQIVRRFIIFRRDNVLSLLP